MSLFCLKIIPLTSPREKNLNFLLCLIGLISQASSPTTHSRNSARPLPTSSDSLCFLMLYGLEDYSYIDLLGMQWWTYGITSISVIKNIRYKGHSLLMPWKVAWGRRRKWDTNLDEHPAKLAKIQVMCDCSNGWTALLCELGTCICRCQKYNL